MATISLLNAFLSPSVQWRKHSLNSLGSRRQKTLRKVSWLGMPLGNSSKPRRNSNLAFPKCSNSTKLSAPQSMAQTAIMRISINECSLVRSIRGSSMTAKWDIKLSAGDFLGIPSLSQDMYEKYSYSIYSSSLYLDA